MKTENAAFVSFDNDVEGLIFDDSTNENYPIKYYNVINGQGMEAKEERSYFGYVYSGQAAICYDTNLPNAILEEGMYFSVSGKFNISGFDTKIIIIEVFEDCGFYKKNKFRAMNIVGGKIEKTGRLKYIDGCTDSLLIPPVKLGDPCLNHLHFPIRIEQTPHTHPSHRIGIVARGNGLCVTPFGNLKLTDGMIFVIKAWDGKTMSKGLDGKLYEEGNHCFFTFKDTMDVIAFHPDSDYGPTDEVHPMINRTIVGGVPASKIESIRTK